MANTYDEYIQEQHQHMQVGVRLQAHGYEVTNASYIAVKQHGHRRGKLSRTIHRLVATQNRSRGLTGRLPAPRPPAFPPRRFPAARASNLARPSAKSSCSTAPSASPLALSPVLSSSCTPSSGKALAGVADDASLDRAVDVVFPVCSTFCFKGKIQDFR